MGRKCSDRLERLGVSSIEQLQEVQMSQLESEFGRDAANLKKWSFGEDDSAVVKTGSPQVRFKVLRHTIYRIFFWSSFY